MATNSIDEKIIEMYQQGDSTHTIAKAMGTYPNKIKRILNKHGVKLRDRREAQQNADAQGRYVHPTKGKNHSEEVKNKISQTVYEQWDNLSDAEKEARRKQAKKAWDRMSDEAKAELQSRAHKAIREAADKGSKLERFLVDYLMDRGYSVIHHSTHRVASEQMEIDVLLPVDKIAIEIDGPSHFEPIWGEKSLNRNIVSDNKKNGILLANGFHVIRIRDKSKKITRKVERSLIKCIEDAIQKLSGLKKPNLIFVEVE